MPRLSDFLSEKLKKQLVQDAAKKNIPAKKSTPSPAPTVRPSLYTPPIPDFVAVDVETTGLEFSSDHIIEVGAVKFKNGKPAEEFSTCVNPGVPIPKLITELTGITDADVANAPKFPEIAKNLVDFIGSLPVCGHQIEFDLTFINKALAKTGLEPIGKNSIDTALLSRVLLQTNTRFSLKHVSAQLSITLDNAHRAVHDARASGEVAAVLIPKLAALPLPVRQTFAAAAPGSYFKHLIYKTLGSAIPAVKIREISEIAHGPRLGTPEKFKEILKDDVESLLTEESFLHKEMPGFAPRASQLAMAKEVTGALNTQSFLVAEAGTGTGKSLAYLLPATLWAKQNNTRVLVATRTINLQDQLFSKELPLIAKGIDFKYSVLKGRSNYICLSRFERLLRGESGNMSVRERFAIVPLIPWVYSTKTGDIEEQNYFNPKWFQKIWSQIAAESYGCAGKRCPQFKNCFLQQARAKAQSSHIVVINHALFFSEMCSETSFLGKVGSIIFDEVHHIESSGHRHLRVELDTSHINLFTEDINNLVQLTGSFDEKSEISRCGREIKSHLKHLRKTSKAFLDAIIAWARKKKESSSSLSEFQLTVSFEDFSCCLEAPAFQNSLETLKSMLYQLKHEIVASSESEKTIELLRDTTSSCQERTSQMAADLGYLVAAKTEDHAFWAEGNFQKGWSKLCGVPLDVAGLLRKIWSECEGAVIFTSATLSISGTTQYFTDSIGITGFSDRLATQLFPSPFSPAQSLYGAIQNAPEPDSTDFSAFTAKIIKEMHCSLKKNILVLFTSNSMLSSVFQLLKEYPQIPRQNILAQNLSGGRNALLEQFKENESMILLGTDSFWEGIDVPGNSCEVVIIPRLPFPVPTHPLNIALQERMEKIKGESFMSFSVSEAVIKFRQGCGRLIRTPSDRGCLLVLDRRIVSKGYGKQFIRSATNTFLTFPDSNAMFKEVSAFFKKTPEEYADSSISYVPLDEV